MTVPPQHTPHPANYGEVRATYDQRDPEPTRPPSPIDDALQFASDRLDRVEHMLGQLNGTLMRLGHNLGPVMRGGGYDDPANRTGQAPDASPTEVDTRGTITRRIAALGVRADNLADMVGWLDRTVEAMDEALEVRA